jgi:diguanylate cyclase (GGDEF)-like protein/putative nucleotidyltransferase with HDIG domain
MTDRPTGGVVSRETAWLLPVVLPVTFAGAAVATAALVLLASDPPSLSTVGGLFALFAAAAFVEAFPVPIEADHARESETSLANVFIVGTAVIYGWEAAAILAFATMLLIECLRRRQQPARAGFNSALYALAAAAAGGAASLVSGDGLLHLLAAASLGSIAFYVVNIGLLSVVIARVGRERYTAVLRRYLLWTTVPFLIMASVTLMLAVLWERSPFLAGALAGPLIAIALYQRSVHRAVEAMRLAATDPLTGLGNHGGFHTKVEELLEQPRADGAPLALVLLDLDEFKLVNDTFGHPMGDRVLAQVASELRRGEEAFRLGGDEFAIVLAGADEAEALAAAGALVQRLGERTFEHGGRLTVSAGVAVFPRHATSRGELVAAADRALYDAKETAKGSARVYRPASLEIGELRRLASLPDREARLRAAASLAYAVDARDAYTGSHSHSVGELAARLATELGLPHDEVELVRLAGRLHDLGKLAIPEEILRKPGPLDDAERLVLERHPHIGYLMLRSLGVEPVATWVRHHHERWDGDGYPDGLEGTAIPLGARIVFVADAWDAMTTERVYGERRSEAEALRECELVAGAQFDPAVVEALRAVAGGLSLAPTGTESR